MNKAVASLFLLGLLVPQLLCQPASTVNGGYNLSWVNFILFSEVTTSDIQRSSLDNSVVRDKENLSVSYGPTQGLVPNLTVNMGLKQT